MIAMGWSFSTGLDPWLVVLLGFFLMLAGGEIRAKEITSEQERSHEVDSRGVPCDRDRPRQKRIEELGGQDKPGSRVGVADLPARRECDDRPLKAGQAAPAATFGQYLLRPALDGDQRALPRFQKSSKAKEIASHFVRGRPLGKPQPVRVAATSGTTPAAAIVPLQSSAVPPRVLPPIRNMDVQPSANGETGKPTAAAPDVAKSDQAKPAAVEPPVDPYQAIGMKVGNFLLKPALELSTGYDSNPTRTPGGGGSPVVLVAPELQVQSQFDRHEITANLKAGYTENTAAGAASHPNVDAKIDGRYDVTDATHINAEARYVYDALLIPGTTQLPFFNTAGGTVGVTQNFGPIDVSVNGLVDRTSFFNTAAANDQGIPVQDRNYTQTGGQTRLTYALMPGFSPFIDVAVDQRVHDVTFDVNGFRRDSTGITARTGVALNVGTISGDVSVGYLARRTADPLLPNVGGVAIDATLAWQATAATSVALLARTQASETVIAGNSAILSRDVIAQVEHRFEPYLIGTLRAGFGFDQYVGLARLDDRYSIAAALVYKLSRQLQLKGEVRQEWTRSNDAVNNFAATVGLIGVRLQY
jgi:hypothetical protein